VASLSARRPPVPLHPGDPQRPDRHVSWDPGRSTAEAIADGSLRFIVPASGGGDAHLLGIDAAGVVTQPFDVTSASVTGPAVTIAAWAVAVSASHNGVLATSVGWYQIPNDPHMVRSQGIATRIDW
jgi:hypothetical protein